MAHSTVLSQWVKFEICILAKLWARAHVFFAHNFMVLAQTSKQITSYEKSLENKKPKLSCTNMWSLSKILSKFMECSFCSKRDTERFRFKEFFSGVLFARCDSPYAAHFWAYFCAALMNFFAGSTGERMTHTNANAASNDKPASYTRLQQYLY